MQQEDLARGQHESVGLLLLVFGACAFAGGVGAHLAELELGFLTAMDTMVIACILMVTGSSLRKWQPE